MGKLNSIVIKVASRCNINCSYCYMYNLGDFSYKIQPKFISKEIITCLIEKLKIYCQQNELKQFHFSLHGGEPLLLNKEKFSEIIEELSKLNEIGVNVNISVQTNAILIDNDWCKLFNKYNIIVGVSIDGPKRLHDKYRVDKNGIGTYDKVIKGINLLKENNNNFAILSVTNADYKAKELYNYFSALGYFTDFLLLDSNYDNLPDYETPMGNWLIELFDLWYNNYNSGIQIRIFDIIYKNILGDNSGIDSLGTEENSLLVLESNGGLEAVDILKICGNNFTKNNLNIRTHNINDAFNDPLINLYQKSGKYLAKKCLACPVNEICGGGYLPHRYSSKNGFNNPSVYCDDLLKLITHIQNKVIDDMPEKLVKESKIQKLSYEEALQIIEETLPTIPEPEYIEKLESFRKLNHEVI